MAEPSERDPDLGPTKATPSTHERLDQTELATRALKLRHQQQQSKMVEEANGLTAHPKADQ